MRINLARRTPVIANATGGLSGPAVLPIAVRMIDAVTRVVDIPVIGMGGVMTSADALELMMAGASAVGVGTANFTDPLACPKIINGLEPLMDDLALPALRTFGLRLGSLVDPTTTQGVHMDITRPIIALDLPAPRQLLTSSVDSTGRPFSSKSAWSCFMQRGLAW
ncbi:dihydroorotate dehydrogenase [Cutibacterium acnes JCM 18909]|nr:dihydroorotate dehydrogenase [Cutibacterium acnes JCM 18909]